MRKKLAHLGPPRAMVLADHNCLRAIFCSLIHELELELKSEQKKLQTAATDELATSQWF